MTADRIVLAIAASLVLTGTALGAFVNSWWLLLPAFVGVNLFQAAFTRFCLMAIILRKCGRPAGDLFR